MRSHLVKEVDRSSIARVCLCRVFCAVVFSARKPAFALHKTACALQQKLLMTALKELTNLPVTSGE